MDVYAICGAGGFGREVMPLAAQQLHKTQCWQTARLVFVDEQLAGTCLNGFSVLGLEEFLALDATRHFNITIANSHIREELATRMASAGARPFSIMAANALDLACNEIGEGAVLCPFAVVTANVRIGRFFHANLYSYVAHDCIIGDFVTFAPNVHCNGAVVIEDHAYLGAGAIIKQGTPQRPIVIGRGAVVGMGAVVTRSVAPGTTVCGNPARPLHKEP
ncbi:acetyltransferase [Pseudomonas piscis]|uniref:Acetyltransferase n=1 Tax=Pseudomonas piscis TaxID=2614538 RepID=A0A7X1U3P4_9PSED|nr:acetyltransferase [Pseudomonas piscis]MQA53444.1 acetyltransferase [Pseudomonas piscis]